MKRNLMTLICAMVFCALLAGIAGCNNTYNVEKLTARQDGTFKILHLTDFHLYLAEEQENPIAVTPLREFDDSLTLYLDAVIENEQPDFVVLGGDNIFCNSGFAEVFYNTTVRTYRAIADYFEEKEIFWTCVFGNHDTEGGCSKRRILKALGKYSGFIGGKEDSEYAESFVIRKKEEVYFNGEKLKKKYNTDDRYANYSIPVYDNTGNDIVYQILTLDTGGYLSPPHQGMPYKEILPEQFEWINDSISRLNKDSDAYAGHVLFLHIPYFDEVLDALDETHVQQLDGIFAGHAHYNYKNIVAVGHKAVICAISGRCQVDSADERGDRFARAIIIDTVRGGISTYCIDADLNVIHE